MTIELDDLAEHFNPDDPRLVGEGPLLGDGLWNAVDTMLERCPVTHSDGQWIGIPTGGWVVSSYADAVAVLGDPGLFSSRIRRSLREEPVLIPMDLDPPLHLEYRRLLQPYLAQDRIVAFEPLARSVITRLLDEFVATGRCADAVAAISHPYASDVQWGWLVGVDEFDRDQVLDWMLTWTHKHFEPEFEAAEREWVDWTKATVKQRRQAGRRDDLIDALLHAEIEGRPLDDDEVVGLMMIMIVGGVTTTADALSNILFRLAVYPELQEELRSDPARIPKAIEELLRIEPPATGPARRCTRDTVLGGKQIAAGEQLYIHLPAANHDPARFEDPERLEIDRSRNAHLAFGHGHHRCLGANFARQTLRVALEEILRRMHDIRVDPDGTPPRRTGGVVWGLANLPLTFVTAEDPS